VNGQSGRKQPIIATLPFENQTDYGSNYTFDHTREKLIKKVAAHIVYEYRLGDNGMVLNKLNLCFRGVDLWDCLR